MVRKEHTVKLYKQRGADHYNGRRRKGQKMYIAMPLLVHEQGQFDAGGGCHWTKPRHHLWKPQRPTCNVYDVQKRDQRSGSGVQRDLTCPFHDCMSSILPMNASLAREKLVRGCSWACTHLHGCSTAKQDLQCLQLPKCGCIVHSSPIPGTPFLEHVSTHFQKKFDAPRAPASSNWAFSTG